MVCLLYHFRLMLSNIILGKCPVIKHRNVMVKRGGGIRHFNAPSVHTTWNRYSGKPELSHKNLQNLV